MEFDFLVIGGGTAGAVIASRLSENPSCRVLLIEAGDDTLPESTPADIQDAFPTSALNPKYFWQGLTATATDGAPPRSYPQARVMGGGSAINGMLALRGAPSDYLRWTDVDPAAFSWEAVVPYFRKVENDLDLPGKDFPRGPHAISRIPKERWPAFVRAMEHAAARIGLPFVPDINETPVDGFFPMPLAVGAKARETSSGCYLSADVRKRRNLVILANAQATKLGMNGGTVVGVDAIRAGAPIHLSARNVVLSSGGIYSPTILLRSGIGPPDHLASLGIQVVIDRPGVGRNLQNHPYMFYALTLPRAKRVASNFRCFGVAGLRASSGAPGCPTGDLFAYAIGRVSGASFGPGFALMASALYAPNSRGFVRLKSIDPFESPEVNFRLMSDPSDPPRMLQTARLTERILRDPDVAAQYQEAFILPGKLAIGQFNRSGFAGKVLSFAAEAAFNSPSPIRRMLVGRAFGRVAPVVCASGGRETSDEEILSSICPMGHPVGTCKMGSKNDSMAVVDESFRVHGTSNLFVVDASVMPVIPSANTNLPTLMLAELAADRIRDRSLDRP
ncbi:GMC family oxidoreductase N-terminal domain-containing protein [uncultured Caballeronia sp.]|uniref:GMC family oxidoreductase n=1 Tax=uncultured Caballeronia sp. TaxID=1827198 RepID=UPI001576964E